MMVILQNSMTVWIRWLAHVDFEITNAFDMAKSFALVLDTLVAAGSNVVGRHDSECTAIRCFERQMDLCYLRSRCE